MTAAPNVIDFPDDDRNDRPSAAIVYVTPDMARRWLTKNTANRPLKKDKIAQYTADMQNGAWQITGEAIKFSKEGRLLDGQNRLYAVAQSGVTVPMFVVRGLDDSSQLVMDSGAPRSAADALGFLGYSQAKDLAPAGTALKAWEDGFYRHCMWQSNPKLTRTELAEFVESHPTLSEVTPWVKRVQGTLPLPIGALGAVAYRLLQIDADAATEFYDRINDLNLGPRHHPLNTLIRRVSAEREVKKRIWVSTAIYYQVRAWNAWRDGVSLSKFQIGSDQRGWAAIPEPK